MRLIDVDKLIDAVRSHETGLEKEVAEVYEAFIGLFEKQPTAFDVDAVLEELEEASFYDTYLSEETKVIDRDKAIEIVKRGGGVNIDCHYCEFAMCKDDKSDVDCYAEDDSYFDHHVIDSSEAKQCSQFAYCDDFPKF